MVWDLRDVAPVLSRTGSIANAPTGLRVGPCMLPEGVLQPSPGAVPVHLLPAYSFIGGCSSQTIIARCVLPAVSSFLSFFLPLHKLAGLQQVACVAALRAGAAGRAELSPAQLSGCGQMVHGQKGCPMLLGGFHTALSCPAAGAISASIYPQVVVARKCATGLLGKAAWLHSLLPSAFFSLCSPAFPRLVSPGCFPHVSGSGAGWRSPQGEVRSLPAPPSAAFLSHCLGLPGGQLILPAI